MILTEQEAKTKRCQESYGPPLTMDGHTYAGASPPMHSMHYGSGFAVQTSPSQCLGSGCMAWRWKREDLYRPVAPEDMKPKDHPHYANFTLMRDAGDYSTTHGYCGKAGKP